MLFICGDYDCTMDDRYGEYFLAFVGSGYRVYRQNDGVALLVEIDARSRIDMVPILSEPLFESVRKVEQIIVHDDHARLFLHLVSEELLFIVVLKNPGLFFSIFLNRVCGIRGFQRLLGYQALFAQLARSRDLLVRIRSKKLLELVS